MSVSELENLSRLKILFKMDFKTRKFKVAILFINMSLLYKPIETALEQKVKESNVERDDDRQHHYKHCVDHRLLVGWPRHMLHFSNSVFYVIDK